MNSRSRASRKRQPLPAEPVRVLQPEALEELPEALAVPVVRVTPVRPEEPEAPAEKAVLVEPVEPAALVAVPVAQPAEIRMRALP